MPIGTGTGAPPGRRPRPGQDRLLVATVGEAAHDVGYGAVATAWQAASMRAACGHLLGTRVGPGNGAQLPDLATNTTSASRASARRMRVLSGAEVDGNSVPKTPRY